MRRWSVCRKAISDPTKMAAVARVTATPGMASGMVAPGSTPMRMRMTTYTMTLVVSGARSVADTGDVIP